MKAYFGHPVAHTKLQPLRLKDAQDIGWCVRNAGGARGFPMPVQFVTGTILELVTSGVNFFEQFNFATVTIFN